MGLFLFQSYCTYNNNGELEHLENFLYTYFKPSISPHEWKKENFHANYWKKVVYKMPSLSLSRYRYSHFIFHFFSHHRKPTQSEMVHEKSILFSCRLFLWGKDPREKKNSLLLILMLICREASYNFIFYPPILAHASVCAQIPLLIRQLVNRKKILRYSSACMHYHSQLYSWKVCSLRYVYVK